MAKCPNCGKKGLFLKLEKDLCIDCNVALAHEKIEQLNQQCREIEGRLHDLNAQLSDSQALYRSIVEKAEAQGMGQARTKMQTEIQTAEEKLESLNAQIEKAKSDLAIALKNEEIARRNTLASVRKIDKYRPLLRAVENVLIKYDSQNLSDIAEIGSLSNDAEAFVSPYISLEPQCLSSSELQEKFRQNERHIEDVFQKYESRCKNKETATTYKLLVIAMKAELQNALYGLQSTGSLEDTLFNIEMITKRYFIIAVSGNGDIAATMKKLIGEINYFFKEAVKLEYEYYLRTNVSKFENHS